MKTVLMAVLMTSLGSAALADEPVSARAACASKLRISLPVDDGPTIRRNTGLTTSEQTSLQKCIAQDSSAGTAGSTPLTLDAPSAAGLSYQQARDRLAHKAAGQSQPGANQ